ncbi:MAG: ABC transporter permease [Caldilineaceae bacterium]
MFQRFVLLYQYRELIRNLVVSDLKGRYKSSALGFVWSLLNPLGMMLVFSLVFGVMLNNGNQIDKYPLFLLCGLLPWNFFADSVLAGINSVVANANLVKKVYFPREVLPIAGVLSHLINFLLAFLVLFVALVLFRGHFSSWLWTLPIVILIQTFFSLGIALILSTLNVYYRDTLMIMNVLMLAWLFLTPVLYPASMIPVSKEIWGVTVDVQRWQYVLNPMASLVNVYRDLLYWGYRTDLDFFIRTTLTAIVVFLFGYWFFIRNSDKFGEEL